MGSRTRIEYSIPSRCLFGYRSEFMTDTKGEGVINTLFDGYQPYKGEITRRLGDVDGDRDSDSFYSAESKKQLLDRVMTVRRAVMETGERKRMEPIPWEPLYDNLKSSYEQFLANPQKNARLTMLLMSDVHIKEVDDNRIERLVILVHKFETEE